MKETEKKHKPIPMVFLGVSVLYFIYIFSQGNSKMIGDEIGGDPGSMVLPLILAIIMFISSFYLFLTDKPVQTGDSITPEEKHLFILTMIIAFAYVICIGFVGFLPCTAIMLFTLCFANLEKDVRRSDAGKFLYGNLLTIAVLLFIYTIGRTITRTLLRESRKGNIPAFLGGTGMSVFIVFLAVTLLIIAADRLFKKGFKNHNFAVSSVISFATTEYLYLVFKQLFMVELVKGFITW